MKHILLTGFILLSLQSFSQIDTTSEIVFSKVEVEASFPGGDEAWNKFIGDGMRNGDFDKFKKKDEGTCRIRFIVDKAGRVTNVEAMTMKKTRLAKLAVEIIENSPRWKPAMQNGKPVNAYREQPIVFNIQVEK
jgi:protein TonB